MADWIKNAHLYAAYKRLISGLKTHRLKVNGWKEIFHKNGYKKKTGVAILRQS